MNSEELMVNSEKLFEFLGGKRRMSGHSKWHNIKTPNLTATSLLLFKYPVLAQFWHNPINKEQ